MPTASVHCIDAAAVWASDRWTRASAVLAWADAANTIDTASASGYNWDMQEDERQLTIDDLAERVGVPVRTVRYYIAEGLLPGPGARGKAATYTSEHLLRLALVRRLVDGHVPLRDIRERMSALSTEDIRALLVEETRRSAELEQTERATSPKAYLGNLLERARLSRGYLPPSPQRHLAPEASEDAIPPPTLRQEVRSNDEERESSTWRHVELAPGLELHVREDAEVQQRDLILQILRVARTMRRGQRS